LTINFGSYPPSHNTIHTRYIDKLRTIYPSSSDEKLQTVAIQLQDYINKEIKDRIENNETSCTTIHNDYSNTIQSECSSHINTIQSHFNGLREKRLKKSHNDENIQKKEKKELSNSPFHRQLNIQNNIPWYHYSCTDGVDLIDNFQQYDDLLPSGDNVTFVLLCGALVMFMQTGFSMIEVGSVRQSAIESILCKNLLDVCTGLIVFFLFGFSLAYGKTDTIQRSLNGTTACYETVPMYGNEFIGNAHAGLSDVFQYCIPDVDKYKKYLSTLVTDAIVTRSKWDSEWCNPNAFPQVDNKDKRLFLDFFFQAKFASTAATIVSGGVAERLTIKGYWFFSVLMTGIIYPLVVSWTWSERSFLPFYYDFAGAGIVHVVGGTGAFVGAIAVKSRQHRYDPNYSDEFKPYSLPMIVLGTFILWFGWYGFNAGSVLNMTDGHLAWKATLVACNTSISAAAGGFTVLVWQISHNRWEVEQVANGILGALVSVTGACANIEPYVAFFVGSISGCLYMLAAYGLDKFQIDDVIQASAVHGVCGFFGVLVAVLFDLGDGDNFFGDLGSDSTLSYGDKVGYQIGSILLIVTWSGFWCGLIFLFLSNFNLISEAANQKLTEAQKVNNLLKAQMAEMLDRENRLTKDQKAALQNRKAVLAKLTIHNAEFARTKAEQDAQDGDDDEFGEVEYIDDSCEDADDDKSNSENDSRQSSKESNDSNSSSDSLATDVSYASVPNRKLESAREKLSQSYNKVVKFLGERASQVPLSGRSSKPASPRSNNKVSSLDFGFGTFTGITPQPNSARSNTTPRGGSNTTPRGGSNTTPRGVTFQINSARGSQSVRSPNNFRKPVSPSKGKFESQSSHTLGRVHI